METVKGAMPIVLGVAMILAVVWLGLQGPSTAEVEKLGRSLADLEGRLQRLERRSSDVAGPTHAAPVATVAHVEEQVSASAQLRRSSAGPVGTVPPAHEPLGVSPGSIQARPQVPQTSTASPQLERLVAEAVTSLAPRYLEQQVRQLYAAEKKADEQAQLQAEQAEAEELRELRLAELGALLPSFVPGLTSAQAEVVAQMVGEEWAMRAAMWQEAREKGLPPAPGEIFRRAREVTDARLYTMLSTPQLQAFRQWRERHFSVLPSTAR